jgi:hypothetical protein
MKKHFLVSLFSVVFCVFSLAQSNRGRIQAQGATLEKSEAWADETVLTKSEAVRLLDDLWNGLSKSEQKDRKQAYADAKRYINNAPTAGICASGKKISKTFQDAQRKDSKARIDIEIITGCAFKDDPAPAR